MSVKARPFIAVLGGLDPSGGAGLQADILTSHALGCHPLPVATCLTIQTADQCLQVASVDTSFLRRQLETLAANFPLAAIKIGAVGGAAVIECLADWLRLQNTPVIFDPVLKAGGGGLLSDDGTVNAINQKLMPLLTLITPNGPELSSLTGIADPELSARQLLTHGCAAVLRTGGHDGNGDITNSLYTDGETRHWQIHRRPGNFRGTGCTLATAIAASMAKGMTLTNAIDAAQAFVSASIDHAYPLAPGIQCPSREAST